jgi:hypothetical protein
MRLEFRSIAGGTVSIKVDYRPNSLINYRLAPWFLTVQHKQPRCRKWNTISQSDTLSWRRLSRDNQAESDLALYLNYCTMDQIYKTIAAVTVAHRNRQGGFAVDLDEVAFPKQGEQS